MNDAPTPPAPRPGHPALRLGERFRVTGVGEMISRDRARFVYLSILPVGISLISFVLSLYGIISARQAPDVMMTMPDRVRIARGDNGAWLYLQPRFINTSDHQRNEIITDLSIELDPVPAPQAATPVPFGWDEQGAWLYNPQTFLLDWQFVADPAPIVVGPNDPQYPLGLFIGPAAWLWRAGTYRVTLTADRTVGGTPLRATLDFTLTPAMIATITNPAGHYLVEVPASSK